MRNIVYIVVFLLGLSADIVAAKTFSLRVEVDNLRDSKGVVQFTLYNRDGTIPDEHYEKYYKKKISKISNNSSSALFKNLPEGRYAINILHDENNNGKIDKGFLLPKEGIGFSNYKAINMLNKPNFKDASFVLDSDMKKVIKVIYF